MNARTQGILNRHARRAREPWLLVTSLSAHQVRAKRIVRLYAQRMQIEEAFRDLKSERFGLGFEVSRSTDTHRIAVLLLIRDADVTAGLAHRKER